MSLRNPSDFVRLLPRGSRVLGLDVGDRTVGVAISDAGLAIATPYAALRRRKRFRETLADLEALAGRRNVGGLVIGLPVNMDGREGGRARTVRQFAANILEGWDIGIAFWDERLSTNAVNRAMIDADMSRKRRDETVDQAAAAFILQGFLDHLSILANRADDSAGPTRPLSGRSHL